eukprot:CAMPEP_0168352608 /NCGR_PEP_ID=MMETSP0213-20121227/22693_1 /TAXON_ID=151035 /ORGANISM="Euplotes harpa, Strain FSP1.4" /LENGTH=122 /DNA_ID=CAMNT_0008363933 /DNA_START=596 /DNA_END=961 /DNA_ORIENTATION=-
MEHERDRPRAMLGRHEHGLLRPLPKNVSDPSRILMPSPRSQMLLLDQRRPRLLRRGIGPLQAGHPVSAEQAVVRDQSRGENRGGVAGVGVRELRERITVIPQEPVVFNNTLRFNLDPENKRS